ncbi:MULTISPECIES: hypothetical protein [Bacillaceae]|uniref:Uncharacterized protein n=1 Tax=Evansella alkalicola TaxID=745819 RepID=A0ABS6JUX3_9BACI|nr:MULTISPECIES: hypothetical protein [Bacillaceae]MBU9720945.1 hypothetical protein [Bacillus alkalicola]
MFKSEEEVEHSLRRYNSLQLPLTEKEEGLGKLMSSIEKSETAIKRRTVFNKFNPVLSGVLLVLIFVGAYLLISQGGLFDGGPGGRAAVPDGMIEYRDEHSGIITIKGEDWLVIDSSNEEETVQFMFIEGSNSVGGISIRQTYNSYSPVQKDYTNTLQEAYDLSDSYSEFIDLFLDYQEYTALDDLKEIEIDNVNGIPIFLYERYEGDWFFIAVIESENTPFYTTLNLSSGDGEDPTLEEVMEREYYGQFLALIQNTKPMSNGE